MPHLKGRDESAIDDAIEGMLRAQIPFHTIAPALQVGVKRIRTIRDSRGIAPRQPWARTPKPPTMPRRELAPERDTPTKTLARLPDGYRLFVCGRRPGAVDGRPRWPGAKP